MKSIRLFLLLFAVVLSGCQHSIVKLFPREPRPFQKREFNSEQWKSGDYQTRGEMTDSKLFDQIRKIKSNSEGEILQLLGKPDAKTKASCCYRGRSGQSGEVDLLVYYIETEDLDNKTNFKSQALKVYFDNAVIEVTIAERDGDHDYFPLIGYFKQTN